MGDEKKMTIYAKMQRARVMLQNKDIKKSGKNKFSNYNYFELSDFLPHINAILDELGLFSMTDINDYAGVLGIYNSENPGECLTFTMPSAAVELKGGNAIQNLGAVQTYIRRYLYISAFEIAESDFIDSDNQSKETNKDEKQKPKNTKTKEEVDKEYEELLTKVTKKVTELGKNGKRAIANKIIVDKAGTPNAKNIKSKEELKIVLNQLNEIK